MNIAAWMKQSAVAFGTSGVRGLVSALTDELCYICTKGYLLYLATQGEFKPGSPVAVAGDLRPSTPHIMKACIAAIEDMGGKVVFCGAVPSPALCSFAYARNMPSLMITGSHIPDDRNGIKFNRACGEFLKTDEQGMLSQDVTLPDGLTDTHGALISPPAFPPVTDILPPFIARYTDFFGTDALKGLKLGIYHHSAVGRDVLMQIMQTLGAEVTPLGRSETFIPVDTEAVRPEDVILAREWSSAGTFDAILTTDGDSDRPLLADETGTWLRGDTLGLLTAQFLKAGSVTTPVSSNTALERSQLTSHAIRTRIGSPYVIDAMNAAASAGHTPAVGYEANGGFLLASPVTLNGRTITALPTRDSVLPMLCALVASQRIPGRCLSALVASLPARITDSDRLKEMPTDTSKARLQALLSAPERDETVSALSKACGMPEDINLTDGVRLTFASGEIVHLRPSGNAPELRVYVEADNAERARALLTLALRQVSRWRD
ncbi:phosphomannomutase [Acetobacter thailandicus]|nr:phosphomannomutase [Acetobacter thailandicus]NHN95646.1 phosphomannomutase [Acetobacter thailandicus]